jgi:hypothetical protein
MIGTQGVHDDQKHPRGRPEGRFAVRTAAPAQRQGQAANEREEPG